MEKLNRAQKCSLLGPQNLGSRGGPGPQGPPGSAPGLGDQQFNFKDRAETFYLNFSVANMAGNELQWELQTMI